MLDATKPTNSTLARDLPAAIRDGRVASNTNEQAIADVAGDIVTINETLETLTTAVNSPFIIPTYVTMPDPQPQGFFIVDSGV
jgi:hypothetical protein